MPQASIDPMVMAAATVLRLQTIVSREVAATESAVLTVGVLQAGTKENVIPDEAIIKLNVRTFEAGVRERVLAAIERIVNGEAEASGAPRKPEITPLDRYPINVNDAAAISSAPSHSLSAAPPQVERSNSTCLASTRSPSSRRAAVATMTIWGMAGSSV